MRNGFLTTQQALRILRYVHEVRGLGKIYPVFPQEKIAWWIRASEIYFFEEKDIIKAKKSINIAKNIATLSKIKLESKYFDILRYL